MLIRRVTMATAVSRKPEIRGAEIGSSDDDRSPRNAIPEVIDTSELKTSPADLPSLKKRGAQAYRGLAVARLLEIAISTRAADGVPGVGGCVVGGSRREPPRGGEGRRRRIVVGGGEREDRE